MYKITVKVSASGNVVCERTDFLKSTSLALFLHFAKIKKTILHIFLQFSFVDSFSLVRKDFFNRFFSIDNLLDVLHNYIAL